MFFAYVIKSLKTGEFYKGITNNLTSRLNRHFKGTSNFARGKLPLKLIHVEICTTRLEARNLEKFLKSGYGREIIKEIDSIIG